MKSMKPVRINENNLNGNYAIDKVPGSYDSYFCSNYLEKVFNINVFPNLIDGIINALNENEITFDAIAFRGTSGSAVGFPLSYAMRKPVVCIRKPGSGHNRKIYEGSIKIRSYIIVDDFSETGHTLKTIRDTINMQHTVLNCPVPICRAIVLYDSWVDEDGNIIKRIKKLFPGTILITELNLKGGNVHEA